MVKVLEEDKQSHEKCSNFRDELESFKITGSFGKLKRKIGTGVYMTRGQYSALKFHQRCVKLLPKFKVWLEKNPDAIIQDSIIKFNLYLFDETKEGRIYLAELMSNICNGSIPEPYLFIKHNHENLDQWRLDDLKFKAEEPARIEKEKKEEWSRKLLKGWWYEDLFEEKLFPYDYAKEREPDMSDDWFQFMERL